MKLQRTPLVLVLVAGLLGIGVYAWDAHKSSTPPADQAEAQPLFRFKEDEIQSLTLKTLVNTLIFEKQQTNGQTTWQMTAPEKAPASDASIAFLTSLLVSSKSDRAISKPANQKAEFGLDQPLATIDIKLTNQQTHTLILGKPNFNRTWMYAIVDPPTDPNANLSILLVPTTFESAVTRPLAEWKKSADKPKPDAKASSSPAPSPAVSPPPASPKP